MTSYTPVGPATRRSAPPETALADDCNFEAVFQIPATHRLLLVRSRGRGGIVSAVSWFHEEYDVNGLLVARYESFAEADQAGRRASGWRKFDPSNRLLEMGEWLA